MVLVRGSPKTKAEIAIIKIKLIRSNATTFDTVPYLNAAKYKAQEILLATAARAMYIQSLVPIELNEASDVRFIKTPIVNNEMLIKTARTVVTTIESTRWVARRPKIVTKHQVTDESNEYKSQII